MQEDDAISEILGGILLVAIVIALAAGVFFMVNVLKKPKEAPANFGLQWDEAHDSVVFVRSTTAYDLDEVEVQMSVSGHFAIGGQATSSSQVLAAGHSSPLGPAGTSLEPGDLISFCVDSAATNVLIQFTHPSTDDLLANHRFDSVAACT